MITIRKSNERGKSDLGWLKSHHSFSFASYFDPSYMGVSALRAINDDWVKPGKGFDTHSHENMEIISYLIKGTIEHRDTMGFHQKVTAGEVQVMSAGSGVSHSEFNSSATEDLHFLQIWIKPNIRGIKPSYQQKDFSEKKGLSLLISPDGNEGSLRIHQNARLFSIKLDNEKLAQDLKEDKIYYLQIVKGTLSLNNIDLSAGDAATLEGVATLYINTSDSTESLLIELPH